ncbi:MAG: T9SS type A sorting domain-containing protein [Bacteroidota bacterium]
MKSIILSLLLFIQAGLLYSQDNNTPALNSFSFSPSSAQLSDNIKVTFSLTASDSQNKVEKIIVEFSPVRGGGSKSETFNKIDLPTASVSGEINFGKNPKSGLWLVSIYLEDDKKNKVTLSSSDIMNLGFNSTFDIIESTTVDKTAPSLNTFSFSPTEFELSSSTLALRYQLEVSDDISGLEEATIEFSPPGKGNGKSESIKKLSGLTASLSGIIDFGKNPDTGIWLASITLKDKTGNQKTFTSEDLYNRSFPSSLEIKETKDITPPRLTGFSFSPMEIDLATEQRTISFDLAALDDISGVEEVTVEFSPPGNGGSKSETFRKISNKTVGLSGSIDLGNNPSTGIWEANITLKDGAGNQASYSSEYLSTNNFASSFEVKDTKDTAPPELIGFRITPSKIDLNSTSQSVEYKLSATDNLSGIEEVQITFIPANGGGNKVERLSKINTTSYEITGWIDFKNVKDGHLFIEVELTDNQRNKRIYKKAELESKGFSSSLEVVNSIDTKQPVLGSFSFDISSQNLTEKFLVIDYNVSVSDDLSGIDEVKIMFEPVDNGGGVFAKFNNIRSSRFDYKGKLELKNPKEGDWTVSVYISDLAKNQITITTAELEKLGYKSKFRIAVSKQLSILSPEPGDIIEVPKTINVSWESKGVDKVHITFSTDNGTTWANVAGNLNAVIRKHNWLPNINKSCSALLRISDSDNGNIFDEHSFQLVLKNATSVEDDQLITEDVLLQNFPNPFNPSTVISYTLKKESKVVLSVYSMLGEKIADLVNEIKPPGFYSINFNAANLTSGYYFYQLITFQRVQTRKMLLMK